MAAMLRRRAAGSFALIATALLSGCGPAEPEVAEALTMTDVVTGWLDKGIVQGQNKIVPAITFTLRNRADRAISNVQVNSVFRIVDEEEELGARLVRAIDGSGLASGAAAGPFVLNSDLGYTSEGSRVQMLQNSAFKDAKVEVFVKHGSRQWVRIGEYVIQRQLLTR